MAVIRVSGHPGSGKTTLCKKLSEILGYRYTYTGGIMREMAAQRGQSIEEFYKKLADDPELEKSVDQQQEDLMRVESRLIVEGRIAPFLQCPYKKVNVLLTVGFEEGARRLMQRDENFGRSLSEVKNRARVRVRTERLHYRKLYGIQNHFHPGYFDIVIDTTERSPSQVLAYILKKLESHSVYPKGYWEKKDQQAKENMKKPS